MLELKKGVYWVGVIDWGIKEFHGHEYSTHRGSSYNAYLIVDEKIALIDTVWQPFSDALIENISKIVDPAKIDYVVAQHAESDHSGTLPRIMELAPNATVVVSTRGHDSIYKHYHRDWKFQPVKTGEKINLGSKELIFIEAPMLHWPDTMFSYLTQDNILFSNDAFGQHYAHSEMYNDFVDQGELYQEAIKYYANILTPFSKFVVKKIDEVKGFNLPVDIIAPSHGIIWRDNPMQIVDTYYKWASGEATEKMVTILFDTMWKATEKMADAMAEGIKQAGIPYKIFNLATSDRNDVLTEVFKAKGVLLGSSTFNNGVLPTSMATITDIKGLKFINKIGAAFGSYGWSGESVKLLEGYLTDSKIEVVQEGIKVQWQPTSDDLEKCRQWGNEFAKKVKEA